MLYFENEPRFKFYVLNRDVNKKKIINFNIFCNIHVYENTLKEVKKYIKSPKTYCYKSFIKDEEPIYGFEAFCAELKSIIRWQEWGRCEYEISVGDHTSDDLSRYEKWDCYMQAEPNIEVIAREVIYQYKQWLKEQKKRNGKRD